MYQIIRSRRTQKDVLKQNRYQSEEGWEMEYLTFPSLENTGLVKHLFTTRLGGVSEGMYATLNLSFQRGDDPDRVLVNYERVAEVLGCKATDIVASHQTHTTNIRKVTEEDRGKGVTSQRDYEDIDGLITDVPGIALACFYADCVPLYFVDQKHRAIGLAHSGWRGTVEEMGRCMIEKMQETYGTRPEDLYAAVGPSICRDCYEVSEDVAEVFRERFDDDEVEQIISELNAAGVLSGSRIVNPGRVPGKYQLDLWMANAVILRRAGIPLTQIAVTDICTCQNPDYLFSHRASDGKRGNLGAFMMLEKI